MTEISKIKLPIDGAATTVSLKDSSAIANISITTSPSTSNTSTLTVTYRGGSSFNVPLPADLKQMIVSTATKNYITGITEAPTGQPKYLSGVANASVYATAGQLNSHEVRIAEKVKQQYNATTQSLDFIFE